MQWVSSGIQYDTNWFTKRAFQSLKKLNDGKWDYSDSLLLYLPGPAEVYAEAQEETKPYYKIVTAPERTYLKSIAQEVVAELPNNFQYIDLGPGTEHKEQFIFDEAKACNKEFLYSPVDINSKYLQLAKEYAIDQGIDVTSYQYPFESLAEQLEGDSKLRFVSLGLTYGNYDSQYILKVLKGIAGEGKIFINAQIRDRVDLKALQAIYTEVAIPMSIPKLDLLGISPSDINDFEVTPEIKVWATLKNTNNTLEELGLKSGDRILLFQSLRPSLEKLIEDVCKQFEKYYILDKGDSFVGVLCN